MHKDKFRTVPTSKAYKDNYADIFGKDNPVQPTNVEKAAENSRYKHAMDAAAGKKDAQWYLDNEQRVSSDPNYQKKPMTNNLYRGEYDRIFRSK
jgi:hypothetical protein|tara:strand:+ start:86 stop:367 length:282 start_codon:yes stop_codon:yes gene_type:complete